MWLSLSNDEHDLRKSMHGWCTFSQSLPIHWRLKIPHVSLDKCLLFCPQIMYKANNCLKNNTDNDRIKYRKQFSDDSAVSQLKTIAYNNHILPTTKVEATGWRCKLRFIKILMDKTNLIFDKIVLKWMKILFGSCQSFACTHVIVTVFLTKAKVHEILTSSWVSLYFHEKTQAVAPLFSRRTMPWMKRYPISPTIRNDFLARTRIVLARTFRKQTKNS